MIAQAVLYTAIGIGVTLFCLLGISWIGPMGAFLNLLTPLPAAYVGMRFGPRSGIIVVAVVSLLLVELGTSYTLMAYLGLFGTGSLLLPVFLQRKVPWDRAVFYATGSAAAVTGIMMIGAVMVNGAGVQAIIDQVIDAEVSQAMQIYSNAGLSAEQLEDMRRIIQGMADFISRSFYGIYLAVLLAIQAMTMLVLQRFSRNKDKHIQGPSFSRWRLPGQLIWVLIAGGFLEVVPVPVLSIIGWNLLVAVLPLYFFQGMAVVHYFLQRKTYPPSVKGIVYLLLLILNPLPIIITSVGVFDLWIDFRRPRQKQI